MNCMQVQEKMLDLMGQRSPGSQGSSGSMSSAANADLSAHTSGCTDCAHLWQSLQSTSAAMDEWAVPETSPYFNTRFQARLTEVKREESQVPSGVFAGFRSMFRRPVSAFHSGFRVTAMALAVAIAIGVGLYQRPSTIVHNNNIANSEISPAVNDLQKLDKNEDLYADFEMLDDLQTDNAKPSAPATSGSKAEL